MLNDLLYGRMLNAALSFLRTMAKTPSFVSISINEISYPYIGAGIKNLVLLRLLKLCFAAEPKKIKIEIGA